MKVEKNKICMTALILINLFLTNFLSHSCILLEESKHFPSCTYTGVCGENVEDCAK